VYLIVSIVTYLCKAVCISRITLSKIEKTSGIDAYRWVCMVTAPPAWGVGKAWGKMMDTWQWTSLLVFGRTHLTYFLIYAVHQVLRSVAAGRNTLDTAFAKMVWSFDALWTGEWPVLDWLKEKIPGAKATHIYIYIYIYVLG